MKSSGLGKFIPLQTSLTIFHAAAYDIEDLAAVMTVSPRSVQDNLPPANRERRTKPGSPSRIILLCSPSSSFIRFW